MIDDTVSRRAIFFAGILGVIGIIGGSFCAHGLDGLFVKWQYGPELVEKRLQQFDTGVRYHLIHTVALLGIAGVPFGSSAVRRWVCRFLILGIVAFSGSLYALALTNNPKFGMITPIGGLCWIAAWTLLIVMSHRGQQA